MERCNLKALRTAVLRKEGAGLEKPAAEKTVLLVDDDGEMRMLLGMVLEKMGHRVLLANNGVEAMQLIRKTPPDLLISDLHMPRMSGFELLATVRKMFPAIKMVAMSSAFAEDRMPDGLAADAFYSKRCPVKVLVDMLQTTIGFAEAQSHLTAVH